jgi:GntR family transcriptional regulator/MocR family aminotransferase
VLDLPFEPDRDAPEPLYVQLAEHLRTLIASGRLPAGEKLPATRELAGALAIGRNTAAQAYQRLIDDGALLAHVGQGTFVSSREAARAPLRTDGTSADASSDIDGPRAFAWDTLFSRSARQALPPAFFPDSGEGIRFDFRCGRVDESVVPLTELRRAFAAALRAPDGDRVSLANFSDPYGQPELREQIARMLMARGIACTAADILVTAGAQQALDLVARVLVDPGDRVAVESPGYAFAAMAFRNAGARLVPIAVDEAGMRTDQLARTLRTHRLKFVYTTPAAQLPTGVVMHDSRRRALLELADETQTPIVEDDYDSEFRYAKGAPPALKTWDAAGQVVYVGTFSKAIFPGLRLGYVVAASALRDRLALTQVQASFGVGHIAQAAMADLLESGAFERHVRRLRRHYAKRRAALLDALADTMPKSVTWIEPLGGLQVHITLPREIPGAVLRAAARTRGVLFQAGETFFLDGRGHDQLALSFANQSPEAIDEGVRLLASAMEEVERDAGHANENDAPDKGILQP